MRRTQTSAPHGVEWEIPGGTIFVVTPGIIRRSNVRVAKTMLARDNVGKGRGVECCTSPAESGAHQ